MKHLSFLFIALSTIIAALGHAAERPNILWIFVDDQGPEWACYGNELVHTPVLDKLASEGTVYTRAFAVAPVCSVSHTSLYTGNYVTTLGVPHHRSNYQDELPEGYFHAEELLSEAGYFTVNMISSKGGKLDRIVHGASGKTDFNFYRKTKNYNSEHVRSSINNQSGGDFFDHIHHFDQKESGDFFKGGEWDKRKEGQPFFAFVNMETGKKHGWDEGEKWTNEKGLAVDASKLRVPGYLADTPEIRTFLARKLNSVSLTDFVVGKFIKALKSSGEYDNTFIFIGGDHGYDFMRNKQTLYDSGLRVPMIVKWPHDTTAVRSGELAALIDVAPTSLTLAGVKVPETMEGIDLHNDATVKARKHIFGTRDGVDGFFDMYRTVRNKQFRYIKHFYPEIPYINGTYSVRYLQLKEMKALKKEGKLNADQLDFMQPQKESAEELYDLENDPDELHNLAGQAEYTAIQDELAKVLSDWMISTNDVDPEYGQYEPKGKLKSGVKVDKLIKLKASKQ